MGKDYLVEGYGVTPCGIVFSTERTQEINNRWGGTTVRVLKGRTIKPQTDGKGRYQYVNLGADIKISVHRLVASVYLPNPDNKPCVHHKDSNTKNNKVTNLEWVTYAENMRYHAADGNVKGFYGKQRLVPCEDTDKLVKEEYYNKGSIKAMEGFMGCTRTTIGRYISKRGLIENHKVNQHG